MVIRSFSIPIKLRSYVGSYLLRGGERGGRRKGDGPTLTTSLAVEIDESLFMYPSSSLSTTIVKLNDAHGG